MLRLLNYLKRHIAASPTKNPFFGGTGPDLSCFSIYYPPFARQSEGRSISFTVCFFRSFFVNAFSTTRRPIHAKFCMRAYSGSRCVFPLLGVIAAPRGGKRGEWNFREKPMSNTNGGFVSFLLTHLFVDRSFFYVCSEWWTTRDYTSAFYYTLNAQYRHDIQRQQSSPVPQRRRRAYHVDRSARCPGILAYRTLLLLSISYNRMSSVTGELL